VSGTLTTTDRPIKAPTKAAACRFIVRLGLIDKPPGENEAKQLGVTPGHLAVLLH
jgi:hypothetical protein